jgi:hypothetical protein
MGFLALRCRQMTKPLHIDFANLNNVCCYGTTAYHRDLAMHIRRDTGISININFNLLLLWFLSARTFVCRATGRAAAEDAVADRGPPKRQVSVAGTHRNKIDGIARLKKILRYVARCRRLCDGVRRVTKFSASSQTLCAPGGGEAKTANGAPRN